MLINDSSDSYLEPMNMSIYIKRCLNLHNLVNMKQLIML